ncbi:unnamed protein product [Oreochromis niloticus]|nr:unnamed protein product [Mustela putorius furo]
MATILKEEEELITRLEAVNGARPKKQGELRAAASQPVEDLWGLPDGTSQPRPLGSCRSRQGMLQAPGPRAASQSPLMVVPGSSTPSLLAAKGDEANCLQDPVQLQPPSGAPVRGSMKLPRYNGEAPPETYLIQVQLAAQLNGWSTEETAVQVALALEGRALQILTDLQPEERLSWPAVARAMQSRFGLRTHADDARDKLASRPRRQEESLGAYAADLCLYARRGTKPTKPGTPAAVKLRRGGTTEELPPATTLPSKSHLRVGRLGQARGLYLDCDLAGTTCRALIDTGSTLSLVQAGVLPGTDGPRPQGWQPTQLHITTVTGERAKVKGERSLPVTVANRTVDHQFWLASIPDRCIIGLDLLAKWEATVDVSRAILYLGTEAVKLHTTKEVPLPASTFSASVRKPEDLSPLAVEGASPSPAVQQLSTETKLAVEDLYQRSCEGLQADQQRQLREILDLFADIFAAKDEDCMQTSLVQHDIDTGDAQPIRLRPRRLPLAKRAAAEQKAGLRLHPKKCHLFRKETTFLGHVVSGAGVSTDPAKVAAVKDWPIPGNPAELRSFLGLASYYRRFVKDFATIASPLHQLTQKGREFRWSEDCAVAFDRLRSALVEAPVLAYPDLQLPFVVDTDASNTDALSRRPCEEKQCRYCQRLEDREGMTSVIASPQGGHERDSVPGGHCSSLQAQSTAGDTEGLEAMDPQQLQHDQNQDPALSRVQCWIGAGQRPSWPEVSALDLETKALYSQWANLTSRNGLLYRRWKAPGGHRELAILTSRQQRDWDQHLPLVLMAYHSAVQESTKCTPAALMFGHELRTPVDLVFGSPPPEQEVCGDPGLGYLHNLLARLREVHQLTRQALRDAGSRQKRAYDTRCKGEGLLPGQHVWVYSPERKKGLSPKLMSQWVGPCTVLERLSDVVYRVRLVKRNRVVVLHCDRLAPYQPLSPPREEPGPQLQPQAPNLASEAAGGPTERPQRHRRLPQHLRDFALDMPIWAIHLLDCSEGCYHPSRWRITNRSVEDSRIHSGWNPVATAVLQNSSPQSLSTWVSGTKKHTANVWTSSKTQAAFSISQLEFFVSL